MLNDSISFKNSLLSEFSLKYLAKFIFYHRVENLAINGGMMPLNTIKLENLKLLNLSNQGLYSQDLFILSQFLKENKSITHINLSKNQIGQKFLSQQEFDQLRQTHKTYDQFQSQLFHSLGIEHFAIALSQTARLKELDISENNIGPTNFSFLQRIFKKNVNIELLNLADCSIDGEQAKQLCENLMHNQRLKYLYLRNSSMGHMGAEAISKLIMGNKSLTELDIYKC